MAWRRHPAEPRGEGWLENCICASMGPLAPTFAQAIEMPRFWAPRRIPLLAERSGKRANVRLVAGGFASASLSAAFGAAVLPAEIPFLASD